MSLASTFAIDKSTNIIHLYLQVKRNPVYSNNCVDILKKKYQPQKRKIIFVNF